VLYRSLLYDLHFFFFSSGDLRALHSFPTRRSSDLKESSPPQWAVRGWRSRAESTCSSRTTRRHLRPRLPASWRTGGWPPSSAARSEEHTSELQSQSNLVCRLLLEKKKKLTRQVVLQ